MRRIVLFFFFLLPVCAFSQLKETFDGPEITSANPWTQSSDGFFLKDGQLLFDAGGRAKGTSYIRVPVSYSADMEWTFDVSMNYNPSNNNHARVYVYATGQPSDVLFFVQVGHNDDNISLYSQKGTDSPVILIKGRKDLLDSDRISVHVKLTKKEDSVWTLYTRPEEKSYYTSEGVAQTSLKDIRSGGVLNLACCYKASSMKDVVTAFDNICVLNEITPTDTVPDDEPGTDVPLPPGEDELPQLVAVTPLTLSSLQFEFDNPVRIDKAVFTISGIGNAERAVYADTSQKLINTSFAEEMKLGGNYVISYKGITDLTGNPLADYSEEVMLGEGEEGEGEGEGEEFETGVVLINEIMADPKGLTALPETEYVELYNASGKALMLDNWQFSYGGKAKPMGVIALPAEGYVVLYRSGRDIKVDPSGIGVPLDNFPSALANSGKDIQLLDPTGHVVDEVSYEKAKPAVSWERSENGWILSTDPRGGTPGSKNSLSGSKPEEPDNPDVPDNPDIPDNPEASSVQPGEIIFNELLPNPFTGGSEYIELYNRSDKVLSLSGLAVAVRKTDGTFSTRYPLASVSESLQSDGYALLTKSKEGVSAFYLISAPNAIFELSRLPVLANTSSTLVLFREHDNVVVDEVTYSSKWHASSVKEEKGVSLERISPDNPTQDPLNWTSASSSAGYGTPGYRNSQYEITPPGEVTGIEAPVLKDNSEIYEISYFLDQPGYNCRASVYNTAGLRVAEIANHELLGTSGRLTWDGNGLSGQRLQTGVYLFYAEIYHVKGKTKSYKKVFLVK